MNGKLSQWHRSRLFWSGLAGLVMLLVTWACTMRSVLDVSWVADTGQYGAGVGEGEIAFYINRFDPRTAWAATDAFGGTGPEYTWESLDAGFETGSSLPSAIALHEDRPGISIGMWFITGSYTLLWLGSLAFWQWWKHRLMTRPLESAGIPS